MAAPLAISSSAQPTLVSLPGNWSRKTSRGILALRLQMLVMIFSCARIRASAPRGYLATDSKCLGTSFSGENKKPRWAYASLACSLSRPCLFNSKRATTNCSSSSAKRSAVSIGSGPLSVSSSSSSVAFHNGGRINWRWIRFAIWINVATK